MKILIVDDNPDDIVLYKEYLKLDKEKIYSFFEAFTSFEGLEILKKNKVDCIIVDYNLPDMDGVEFIEKLPQKDGAITLPIIALTGLGNENIAVEFMKKGAMDYLPKNNINPDILIRTIRYAINQKQSELEKIKINNKLKEALANVKQLKGLLPICSNCKKIRDDKGYWENLEKYITKHSNAMFTHGFCPECASKLYDLEIDQIL
ncbi:MAG: response regulator [Desulfobacterales bacterium]|nr:response regulator [Desulfobacterales bacterium]